MSTPTFNGPYSYGLYLVSKQSGVKVFRMVQHLHGDAIDHFESGQIEDCLKHYGLPANEQAMGYWLDSYIHVQESPL